MFQISGFYCRVSDLGRSRRECKVQKLASVGVGTWIGWFGQGNAKTMHYAECHDAQRLN